MEQGLSPHIHRELERQFFVSFKKRLFASSQKILFVTYKKNVFALRTKSVGVRTVLQSSISRRRTVVCSWILQRAESAPGRCDLEGHRHDRHPPSPTKTPSTVFECSALLPTADLREVREPAGYRSGWRMETVPPTRRPPATGQRLPTTWAAAVRQLVDCRRECSCPTR